MKTKFNKWKGILILLPILVLSSCGTMTREIYSDGQFEDPIFSANYYTYLPSSLQTATDFSTYQLNESNSKYGEIINNTFTQSLAAQDVIRNLPNAATIFNKLYGDSSTLNDYEKTDAYYEQNALGKINDSFRYGYFSKLTDGLAHCDGSGARVRIQATENGFGTIFNRQLTQYYSFVLALRGGTDIPWGSSEYPVMSDEDSQATIELTISFYIMNSDFATYKRISFTKTIETRTDDHGSNTNILQFYFNDVMGSNVGQIKNAAGFSLNYEILEHNVLKPGGVSQDLPYKFGLMIYEMELPSSRWN